MKNGTFVDRLTAILVEHGVIPEKEVAAIHEGFAKAEKAQFDDFLLEEGLIDADVLLQALSEYYKVPSFDVRNHFFDTHLIHMFPKDFLLRNAIIPLERDENMLIVVASNPQQDGLEAALGEYVSYDINFYVGIRRGITDAVQEFYDRAPTQVIEDIDLREERRLEREKDKKVAVDEVIEQDKYKKPW